MEDTERPQWQRFHDRCIHFTGIEDETCAAGVRYQLVSRHNGRCLALIGWIGVVLVTTAACADRSYAPPETPDVVTWRTWLIAGTALAIVGWIGYWVLAFKVGGWLSADTASAWIRDLLTLIISSLLSFTVAGQVSDWMLTAIHGWGVPGIVILVVGSGLAGLGGPGGLPIPAIIVLGFLYPRPEVLPWVAVPPLILQIPAYALRIRRLGQALRSGREF